MKTTTYQRKYEAAKLTNATVFYSTPERAAADERFQTMNETLKTLRAELKIDSKNKDTKKAIKAYETTVDAALAARNALPSPKRSASFMAAEILADLAESIADDKAKIDEYMTKMRGNIAYNLGWYMADMVKAESRAKYYSRIIYQIQQLEGSDQAINTLPKLLDLIAYFNKDLQEKVNQHARKLISRSSLGSANMVEDCEIECYADLIDSNGLSGNRSKYYRMIDPAEIKSDEAEFWPTIPTETYFTEAK
jgi:hypothetical protein